MTRSDRVILLAFSDDHWLTARDLVAVNFL